MDAQQGAVDVSPRRNNGKQRAWRVWFLVALWIVLIVQGGVDGLSRLSGQDAFPTVAMPGFSASNVGTNGQSRVTERQIYVIDASGTSHSITPAKLLEPMPVASAAATLDRIFKPSAKVAPALATETVQYLRGQAERLTLSTDPVGLRLVWQPELLDTRTLQTRPASEATVREVTW